MNQDCNTVARYVPLKIGDPSCTPRGAPLKNWMPKLKSSMKCSEYFKILDRNFIFQHILTKNRKKTFKISFQYLENDPLNVLNPIVDMIEMIF